ncbi:hypothetical protein ADL26_11470, partial [Thermoactinomyces vulgaris]
VVAVLVRGVGGADAVPVRAEAGERVGVEGSVAAAAAPQVGAHGRALVEVVDDLAGGHLADQGGELLVVELEDAFDRVDRVLALAGLEPEAVDGFGAVEFGDRVEHQPVAVVGLLREPAEVLALQVVAGAEDDLGALHAGHVVRVRFPD